MNQEKRLRAASQLVSLSSISDEPMIVDAQDRNFSNIDWSRIYGDLPDDRKIIVDFVRAIVDDEAGCDAAAIRHLNEYDRAAVIHGMTIAYTHKAGIENG